MVAGRVGCLAAMQGNQVGLFLFTLIILLKLSGLALVAGLLTKTTLNNGYLGSRNDEERSEMRYVV